jgi:hypothetical protein
METKLFELRAVATCIPIIATKLSPSNDQDQWLLAHIGYGATPEEQSQYIMIARLEGGSIATANANRHPIHEMRTANKYLNTHFDELESGAVIDVDFIEGRTDKPVKSDRFYNFAGGFNNELG